MVSFSHSGNKTRRKSDGFFVQVAEMKQVLTARKRCLNLKNLEERRKYLAILARNAVLRIRFNNQNRMVKLSL